MSTQNITYSSPKTTLIIWTLLCLMPMVGMAVDLYAPSLPAIAHDLSVSNNLSKNLIAIYLLGYALGNFVTGFLTDTWGRKMLFRSTTLVFVIVTLIPPFFPTITVLLGARFLQGFALGMMVVLIRSIFSDILDSQALVKLGTWLGTMWGLGPVLGPVIGGYLQFYMGWQSCFYFMAILGVLALIAIVAIIPETSTKRHALNFATMRGNLMEVLRHRVFIGTTMIMGFVYSLLITFQTSAPFLIQATLGHSALFFGRLALILGLVFLSATFICRALLKKVAVDKLLRRMLLLFFSLALLSFLISLFFPNNLMLITLSSGAMFFSCGFTFPLSMGKGLAISKQMSAVATAMMYLINICMTSITSFILSFFESKSMLLLTSVDVILLLLAVLTYWTMVHTRSNP